MYAIFEDGSRQYRVSEGDRVRLDWREAEIGSRIELGRVLLFANGDDVRIGRPMLDGIRVLAEVIGHPSTKIQVQHFRRRKNSRRLRGHRQHYVEVRVQKLLMPGEQAPPPPAAAPAEGTPAEGAPPAAPQPAGAPGA